MVMVWCCPRKIEADGQNPLEDMDSDWCWDPDGAVLKNRESWDRLFRGGDECEVDKWIRTFLT